MQRSLRWVNQWGTGNISATRNVDTKFQHLISENIQCLKSVIFQKWKKWGKINILRYYFCWTLLLIKGHHVENITNRDQVIFKNNLFTRWTSFPFSNCSYTEIPHAKIKFVYNKLNWDERDQSYIFLSSYINFLKQCLTIAVISALGCFQTESVSTKYQREELNVTSLNLPYF